MPDAPAPVPSRAVGLTRIVVGLSVITVLVHTYLLGISAGRTSLIDYFGYFTNLTSLLTSALLLASGALALRGRRHPLWLSYARGVAVTCMLLVAVIYNLIVPGTGSAPAWVSAVLHAVFPLLVALDWLLIRDRPSLAWRHLWVVTVYPLVWIVVVLIRGATDGWVPYGFLLPSHGPAVLAAHVAGLLAALLALGALVWLASRFRLVRRKSPGP
ncbi:Pr6Pr family membrane protein [Microbacterium sp. kSW2-24]|uniref:Pr6Pr family membrane protein n=1 Tax=Microbacterium galbinum TaxID=2851646 RepID=UPI001FFD0FFB|nr:Pr6Pr family membrane protein [Microbacterium galbinum]MCK2023438.1 Pr6Pr family membrane protein [Microbacterium galbinum]